MATNQAHTGHERRGSIEDIDMDNNNGEEETRQDNRILLLQ